MILKKKFGPSTYNLHSYVNYFQFCYRNITSSGQSEYGQLVGLDQELTTLDANERIKVNLVFFFKKNQQLN
jgi:hypothetical protein